jgi:pimeloyl-ACP methyl ester carboxylesterase
MIEAVEVETSGGLVLRGELRRRGPDWVVLVHDAGADLDAWRPLAGPLAAEGMSVLALDLRGHGGSDGEPSASTVGDDTRTAIGCARASGAASVVVGAAGSSSAGALAAAEAGACLAFFALAPVGAVPDASLPRLAVVGSRDPEQEKLGSALVQGAGWSVVVRVPLASAGCRILESSWSSNVRDYVLAFLRDQRRADARATMP